MGTGLYLGIRLWPLPEPFSIQDPCPGQGTRAPRTVGFRGASGSRGSDVHGAMELQVAVAQSKSYLYTLAPQRRDYLYAWSVWVRETYIPRSRPQHVQARLFFASLRVSVRWEPHADPEPRRVTPSLCRSSYLMEEP